MLNTTVNSALQIIRTVFLYSDVDKLSVVDCELGNGNYRLDTENRKEKKGGGLALLFKKEYNPTRIQLEATYDTLEYAGWTI